MGFHKLSWESIWMHLAFDLASRSTCSQMNRRVGCVIVDAENSSVLSVGYNGNAKGRDNNCEIVDTSRKDTISNCTCVHAEANALIKMNYNYPFPVVMYLTLSPCETCAKMIVNAGISKVVYADLYSKEVLKILTDAGIKVCQLTSYSSVTKDMK